MVPASFDEIGNEVAAVEKVLAHGVRIAAVAFADPGVVLSRRIDLALPPRHPTDAGLEEVGVHPARDLVDRCLEHLPPKRFARTVVGAITGDQTGDVVAVNGLDWRLHVSLARISHRFLLNGYKNLDENRL